METTSPNGVTGTWAPATINTATPGTSNYVFTPAVGQCATTQTLSITITAQTVPDFAAIGPLCQNSTAPALGNTSPNGVTGTWAPATINTATPGTSNYVFTPAVGQCATTQTLSITITAQTVPDFAAIGPLCQNSTAPALGNTSPNGVTGTWAPATINTATAGTSNYVFTPAAGQCATTQTLSITITAQTVPDFAAIGPLCQNSTAPALGNTSPNGVTGTWAPATINTATAGTSNYVFTPAAGQCATTQTLSITITAQTVPDFAAIGPLCQNSTAPALGNTSPNGVTGTWAPATINTATAGTSNYVFTPAVGPVCNNTNIKHYHHCSNSTDFAAIGPLCQNSTAPALGNTSPNGVTGTWAPATINTATAGTSNYVFTPAVGQCATTQTLSITITAQTVPDFAAIGPLCQNSTAPALGTTSPNGVTGTWAPATINTATAGTSNYVFTPAAGQCATTQTLSITITAQTVPDFAAIGPLCQNSTAPALGKTSPNGVTGTWAPATINTATPGTSNYVFTPAVGQCATTQTLSITITAQTVPDFAAIGPLCQNSTAPALGNYITQWSYRNLGTGNNKYSNSGNK